jgi:uncharacterized protein
MVELEVIGIVMQLPSEDEKQRLRDAATAAGAVIVDSGARHQVRLKERDSDRVLTFGIGEFEARAIEFATQGLIQPRPMTHDFICNLLGVLDDVSATGLVLTRREQGTFYAELDLAHGDRRITVDCRPSDGIAVALRLGIPIMAASALDPEFEARVTGD